MCNSHRFRHTPLRFTYCKGRASIDAGLQLIAAFTNGVYTTWPAVPRGVKVLIWQAGTNGFASAPKIRDRSDTAGASRNSNPGPDFRGGLSAPFGPCVEQSPQVALGHTGKQHINASQSGHTRSFPGRGARRGRRRDGLARKQHRDRDPEPEALGPAVRAVEPVALALTGTDPAYGIGARFSLFSAEVRAEYEHFDVEDTDVRS